MGKGKKKENVPKGKPICPGGREVLDVDSIVALGPLLTPEEERLLSLQ